MSNSPPYRPGAGYSPRGDGGGAPAAGATGAGFAVVGGRAYDPKPPPELVGMVRAWAKGKAWRRSGQASVTLPWVSIDLVHVETDRVIHPYDDVGGYGGQPDDLSHDLWERAKGYVRMLRRTDPVAFIAKCRFADAEGRETFEECPMVATLPPEDQQWGQHASPHYQGRGHGLGYGAAGAGRYGTPAGHITEQEISVMAMGMNLLRDLADNYKEDKREDRATIRAYQAREVDTIKIFQGLMQDKAKQEREQLWEQGKIAALKMIAGRLSKIAPIVGVQLSQIAGRYMGGGARKQTPREELAFETLRGILRRAKSQGADTPDKLFKMLEMMGIGENDELREDIVKLLIEITIDDKRRELGAQAAGLAPDADVLVAEEKPANAGADDESSPLGGDDDVGDDDEQPGEAAT